MSFASFGAEAKPAATGIDPIAARAQDKLNISLSGPPPGATLAWGGRKAPGHGAVYRAAAAVNDLGLRLLRKPLFLPMRQAPPT